MNVVWVTSFAADMYETSGKPLINTFCSSKSDGRLLVCQEGMDLTPETGQNNLMFHRIDDDPLLTGWLADNKDSIPIHLGGSHAGCRCEGGPYDPHSKRHTHPCVGYWFCRNASRWFRKYVAIKEAMSLKPDIVIWLDSDCVFRRRTPVAEVVKWFPGRAGVFYLKDRRAVLEAGVVGYYRDRGGERILHKVIACYTSGRYRTLDRWDDCYVLQKIMLGSKDIKVVDLAKKVGDNSVVLPHSIVGRFIAHDKGRHGRKLGIMK